MGKSIGEQSYVSLFDGLKNSEIVAIVSDLRKKNIPYKINSQKNSIFVPSEKILELKDLYAKKAVKEIPTENAYKSFFNSGIGVSAYEKKIKLIKAKKKEICRLVSEISFIRDCNMAIPISINKRTALFEQNNEFGQISVILKLEKGYLLTKELKKAVVNITKSSLKGIKKNEISIYDQSSTFANRLLKKNSVKKKYIKKTAIKAKAQKLTKAQVLFNNFSFIGSLLVLLACVLAVFHGFMIYGDFGFSYINNIYIYAEYFFKKNEKLLLSSIVLFPLSYRDWVVVLRDMQEDKLNSIMGCLPGDEQEHFGNLCEIVQCTRMSVFKSAKLSSLPSASLAHKSLLELKIKIHKQFDGAENIDITLA